jgi:flagellin
MGLDATTLATLRMNRLHQQAMFDSLAKLATGSRFAGMGRGFANPSDLIASETLRATLTALDAETQSNQRALAVSTVADGALGEISGLLGEVRSLVAANADGGLSDAEKDANQIQIDSVLAGIDRLAGTTNFLGEKLLGGDFVIASSGEKLKLDSAGTSDLGEVEIDDAEYSLQDLKTGGPLTSDAEKASQVIDAAIKDVATARGRVGAFAKNHVQARLNSLGKAYDEIARANSMLADVDYAAEVSRNVREQILTRATLFTLKTADHARRNHLFNLLK